MFDSRSDRERLRSEQLFFEELDQDVRAANRDTIRARIPELSKESIHGLAVLVGRLRASYLQLAFRMCAESGSGDEPQASLIDALRARREMFEEARAAYEALRHAIERGYIDMAEAPE